MDINDLVDLAFPHSFSVEEDLLGPYVGDKELKLPNSRSGEFARFWIGYNGVKRLLSIEANPSMLSGIFSVPNNENVIAAGSAGDCFLLDVETWEKSVTKIPHSPFVEHKSLVKEQLLLLIGFTSITALGSSGAVAWTTKPISLDGLRLTGISNGHLHGFAFDTPDEEVPFSLDLKTGVHSGGTNWGVRT
jgi:hypothetical protein